MTYINETDGKCATVTSTKRGFVVCLIDVNTEDAIVQTFMLLDEKEANRKARYWVQGRAA